MVGRVEGPITAFPQEEGWFEVVKKPIVVHARRLGEDTRIVTLHGETLAVTGDYLMVGPEGEPYPHHADGFNAAYSRATAPSNGKCPKGHRTVDHRLVWRLHPTEAVPRIVCDTCVRQQDDPDARCC